MITAKCVKNSGDWCNYPELEINKEYEVTDIEVGKFYSLVYLIDCKKWFNSICFELFENGKPLNYLSDKRFNPYLPRG